VDEHNHPRLPEPAVDLRSPPPGHTYTSSITPQENEGDQRVRRFREYTATIVTLVLVGVIAWLCVRTLLSSDPARAEGQKWAMSILSAAAAGLIGYLVRKLARDA